LLDIECPWSSFGWYLAAPEHRPGWMHVDRLLGEHGIQEDSAVVRQEFERHMEARRLEEADGEELKPLRRGWCLGSEQFRQEMLEWMDGKLGENHSGELHRETAEQKANRILSGELSRRGWTESDLSARRRSDPDKLAIAVRLRDETSLPVKWIGARVQIGTVKRAKSVRHPSGRGQHQHKPARADEPCAQLEFQSTADPFPVQISSKGTVMGYCDAYSRREYATLRVPFCSQFRRKLRTDKMFWTVVAVSGVALILAFATTEAGPVLTLLLLIAGAVCIPARILRPENYIQLLPTTGEFIEIGVVNEQYAKELASLNDAAVVGWYD
jgi:hypothetical protein